ncbi:hypothetical protein LY76DRAFT_586317 [Colletotrichum caudatum]|nr:hypothetical protein LY76DRAFT_586317 [Colletotrichum caudatum]
MSSLTTTVTPAASCTYAGIAHIQVNEVQYFLLQGPPASSTDCFPGGYDPLSQPQHPRTLRETRTQLLDRPEYPIKQEVSFSPVSAVADKGLSSGAVAGIGIGAGAAVILAGLLGFWIPRRRRRNKHAVASKEQAVEPSTGWGDLPAELKQTFVRHEMEGDHQYPYKPGDPPRELDTSR